MTFLVATRGNSVQLRPRIWFTYTKNLHINCADQMVDVTDHATGTAREPGTTKAVLPVANDNHAGAT